MPEITFDPVDMIGTGAIGEPGDRVFYIQAFKGGQILSVLVEKEQVAVLSERMTYLLSQVAEQFPEVEAPPDPESGPLESEPVPLFRAVAIGIGFDPARRMVVLELHEHPVADEEEGGAEEEAAGGIVEPPPLPGAEGEGETEAGEEDGYLARLYLTPAQARAMANEGIDAVAAGRPPCPLCGGPLDPEGHVCPRLNGHTQRST